MDNLIVRRCGLPDGCPADCSYQSDDIKATKVDLENIDIKSEIQIHLCNYDIDEACPLAVETMESKNQALKGRFAIALGKKEEEEDPCVRAIINEVIQMYKSSSQSPEPDYIDPKKWVRKPSLERSADERIYDNVEWPGRHAKIHMGLHGPRISSVTITSSETRDLPF